MINFQFARKIKKYQIIVLVKLKKINSSIQTKYLTSRINKMVHDLTNLLAEFIK